MGLYPLFLDLTRRRATVVGGGRVAERKVSALLEAEASVVLVSPGATAALAAAAGAGRLEWRRRPFAPGDLAGAAVAFAATDRRDVNAAVAAEAAALGIPCNVADDPEACSFFVPALVRRGDLLIAVSTGGASPAAARRVREALEGRFGPEWGPYLALLSAVRRALLAPDAGGAGSRELLDDVADLDLLPLVRRGDWQAVEGAIVAAAERRLGVGAAGRFTLAALGLDASRPGPTELRAARPARPPSMPGE